MKPALDKRVTAVPALMRPWTVDKKYVRDPAPRPDRVEWCHGALLSTNLDRNFNI